MKKAFTLVELLIVIGIIGILSGVLLVSMGGTTESARSAKCLANMRNLASACQNYGMSCGYYPLAAATEFSAIDESSGIRNVKMRYSESNPVNPAVGKAWIGWYSNGAYASKPTSSIASASFHQSPYASAGSTGDEQIYCITNGALWASVNGNREAFVCPSHAKAALAKGKKAFWSYEMNGYFGGDVSHSAQTVSESYGGVSFANLKLADRRVLFAELPFDEFDDPYADTAIQYKGLDAGSNQGLAFNHASGKRKCAHVVYADGHVDKLTLPRGGGVDQEELMDWLCRGLDISFNGSTYEKLED